MYRNQQHNVELSGKWPDTAVPIGHIVCSKTNNPENPAQWNGFKNKEFTVVETEETHFINFSQFVDGIQVTRL